MVYLLWSLRRLVNAICDRLTNKFDVFMIIEGKRGLGKSTLAYILMCRVRREMKKREVEGYKFSPRQDLLYQRDDVIKFFHKRKHSGVADEMINVTFNRDFYQEQQKDLVKMINMNRDHNNFFIACVPQFKNLDSQIKNLCSMKITVVRRGISIVHTPNKTIYARDIWDEAFNEKIEREWMKGGLKNPRYSKLSTYRGFLNFPKLSEKQENIYQKIKDDKRNIIAQDKGIEEKKKDPFNIIYEKLINKQVKNTEILDGMIFAYDLDPEKIKGKIRRKLKEEKKKTALTSYYYDEKKSKDLREMESVFG
jgi:hypothetical protein